MRAILPLSGGLNSAILLRQLLRERREVIAFAVDYGQAARDELICAGELARQERVEIYWFHAPNADLILSRAGEQWPQAELLWFTFGVSLAVSQQAQMLAWGSNAVDRGLLAHLAAMTDLYSVGEVAFYAPFASRPKADLLSAPATKEVHLGQTWSCWRGDRAHCAECDGCKRRRAAFAAAALKDPVRYATDPPVPPCVVRDLDDDEAAG